MLITQVHDYKLEYTTLSDYQIYNNQTKTLVWKYQELSMLVLPPAATAAAAAWSGKLKLKCKIRWTIQEGCFMFIYIKYKQAFNGTIVNRNTS